MYGTLQRKNFAPLDYRYALDASMPLLAKTRPFVRCDVPELLGEIRQRLPFCVELASHRVRNGQIGRMAADGATNRGWAGDESFLRPLDPSAGSGHRRLGAPPAVPEPVEGQEPNLPTEGPSVALWVEPLRDSWQEELTNLTTILEARGRNASLSDEGLLIIVASRPLARLLPERAAWHNTPLGLRPGGLYQLCRRLEQVGFVLSRNEGIHSLQAIFINRFGRLMARLGRAALSDRLEFAARLRYRATGRGVPLSTVALLVARKNEAAKERRLRQNNLPIWLTSNQGIEGY